MDAATATIVDALPHRPPFRFLSEVTELVPGKFGEGLWRVTGDEAMLTGHFPGLPIVPGTLIAEAMAQLSGLVAFFTPRAERDHAGCRAETSDQPGKLAHVDLRFKQSVVPPAAIILRSRMRRTIGVFRQFDVSALCNEGLVARGQLTLSAVSGQGAVSP